jgi:hypothetical protein
VRQRRATISRAGLYVEVLAPILIGLAILLFVVLLFLYGGHGGTP